MLSVNQKNNDTLCIKQQLASIQARLMKLSTGLEQYSSLEDENVFRSRNTAHFASDEEEEHSQVQNEEQEQEEKSFQQLNNTQLEVLEQSAHQFKKPKPLFLVASKAIENLKLTKSNSKSPIGEKKRISFSEYGKVPKKELLKLPIRHQDIIINNSPEWKRKHYLTQQDDQVNNKVLQQRVNKPPLQRLIYPDVKKKIIIKNPITPNQSFHNVLNSRPGSAVRQQQFSPGSSQF